MINILIIINKLEKKKNIKFLSKIRIGDYFYVDDYNYLKYHKGYKSNIFYV